MAIGNKTMSKTFEEKIASELKNVDAPVSKSMWDSISHGLDHPFEHALKNRLNTVTPLVGTGVWEGIEAQLPSKFEGLVNDKVNHMEVPPNPAIWAALDQNLEKVPSPFETKMATKFNGFIAPAPTGTLEAIEAKLDEGRLVSWKKTGATLVAILLVFGVFVLSPVRFSNSGIETSNWTVADADADKIPSDFHNNSLLLGENSSDKGLASEQSPSTISNDQSFSGKVGGSDHGFSRTNGQNNNGLASSNMASLNNDKSTSSFNTSNRGFYDAILGPNLVINQLQGANMGNLAFSYSPLEAENSLITPVKTKGAVSIGLMAAFGNFRIKTSDTYDKGLFNGDFLAFDKSLRTGGSYSSLGTSINVPVSPKASFTSGLEVVLANETMHFSIIDRRINNTPINDYALTDNNLETDNYRPQSNILFKRENTERTELQLVPNNEVVPDSIITGEEHTLINQMMVLDIPLGMEFRLKEKGKSSITARIGAKVRLIASANTFHSTNDRTKIVEVSPETSHTFYQTSMAGFSSINYSRKVGKDMEWYIGPEVCINTTDLNRVGTWASMRPFQVGINMGIRQYMN